MAWIDAFGNRIIGQLGDASAGPAPLNQPPLPTEYTDSLLGVGQWPSVSVDYQVVSGPGITLTFSFDPTVYLPSSQGWQDKATKALGVYSSLFYQLLPSVVLTLETSLLPGARTQF